MKCEKNHYYCCTIVGYFCHYWFYSHNFNVSYSNLRSFCLDCASSMPWCRSAGRWDPLAGTFLTASTSPICEFRFDSYRYVCKCVDYTHHVSLIWYPNFNPFIWWSIIPMYKISFLFVFYCWSCRFRYWGMKTLLKILIKQQYSVLFFSNYPTFKHISIQYRRQLKEWVLFYYIIKRTCLECKIVYQLRLLYLCRCLS